MKDETDEVRTTFTGFQSNSKILVSQNMFSDVVSNFIILDNLFSR